MGATDSEEVDEARGGGVKLAVITGKDAYGGCTCTPSEPDGGGGGGGWRTADATAVEDCS